MCLSSNTAQRKSNMQYKKVCHAWQSCFQYYKHPKELQYQKEVHNLTENSEQNALARKRQTCQKLKSTKLILYCT